MKSKYISQMAVHIIAIFLFLIYKILFYHKMKKLIEYVNEMMEDYRNRIFEDDLLGGGDDDGGGDDGGDGGLLGGGDDDGSSDGDDDKKDDDPKPAEDPKKKEEKKDKEHDKERGAIKFTIWKEPDKKVQWLKDGEGFQKIEYKYENKKKGIEADFLLGFQDESWKLWVGKIGAVSYDDDPYCSFNTTKFSEGIILALDKVQEILADIKGDPLNYIQFYKNL